MSEWRPIETAPKDSSEILVCGGYRHAVAYWDEDDEAWVSDYRGKGNGAYVEATHWMPLPELPK